MNEEFSHNNMIEPELQVRLMNLVMGEASDFERDQLQTLMEQRAELATYYQHLEHLHGLLGYVGNGDVSLDVEESSTNETWQLPADKREQLLAVLDGKVDCAPVRLSLASDMKTNGRLLRRGLLVTAAFVAAASLLMALTLNSFNVAQRAMLARREYSLANPAAKTVDNSSSMEADGLKSLVVSRDLLSEPSIAAHDSRVRQWDVNRGQVMKGKESSQPVGEGFGIADTKLDSFWFDATKSAATGKPSSVEDFAITDQFGATAAVRSDANSPTTLASPEQTTVTVPDESTIMFGGIKRFSNDGVLSQSETESKSKSDGEARLPMTVTPRIIIPENEEVALLSRDGEEGPVEKQLAEQVQKLENEWARRPAGENQKVQAGQAGEGREKIEKLSERSEPTGTKEVPIAEPSFEQQPAEVAIGADTNGVLGDVQIEHIEDLDLVIIKGAQRDVERTLEVIDGIKKQQDLAEKDEKRSEVELPSLAQGTVPETTRQEIRAKMQVLKESMAKKQQQAAESKSDEKQIAALVEYYNDLMQEGRYAEAELIAKKAGQVAPDSQITKMMEQNTELAKRNAESNGRLNKADNYTDLMNQVDSAFIIPSDAPPQSPSTSNADRFAGRLWRYIAPPSPQVASNPRAPSEVERKFVELKQAEAIDEQSAATEAFSTFSLHVSDVSFKLAQAALAQGQWPEAAKIRIEEFVNALDYHDPLPAGNEKVACRVEQAIHPFLMQRNLLRISMRTAATGRAQNTPLRLTIVIDNSGSMERADRRQAVVQAMRMLTKQLRASDQVTLISFANTPRLLAEKVVGDQGASLVKLIENLPSEGGTNIEAALLLAREKALEQQVAGAQNRIVLLTDGAVNLGNANPESLAKLVTQLRDAGIAFDAAGISAADLNDEVLEALTRQGDGRYYLLDSADAVAESFAAQIAGALRPSAQNVKVQVEFNPKRVGRYKLLGFEKHRLNKEDFSNDKVDAAEMAAAEAGVAVYHYEIKPNGSGDVGSVSVRFRDLSTGQMIERRWPIPYDSSTPRLEQAEPTMQLAATAALFAAKLSGGPLADSVDIDQLHKLLASASEQYAAQPRVVQLRTMIEQAKAIQK